MSKSFSAGATKILGAGAVLSAHPLPQEQHCYNRSTQAHTAFQRHPVFTQLPLGLSTYCTRYSVQLVYKYDTLFSLGDPKRHNVVSNVSKEVFSLFFPTLKFAARVLMTHAQIQPCTGCRI